MAPSELIASSQPDSSQEEKPIAGDLPRAELPETVFDFDRIERGTSMRHSFAVKNAGTVPLVIHFESNTCKCTGVELGGNLVEPGRAFRCRRASKQA